MEEKIRVLHLMNRWYPKGGIEHFIQSLVERTAFNNNIEYHIASMLTSVNSSVPCAKHGPILKSGSILGLPFEIASLGNFLKTGKYDVIHIHTNNGTGFLYAHAAKKAGVIKRVVHCHNAGVGQSCKRLKEVSGSLLRSMYLKDATDRWACSANAGEYLFSHEKFRVFLSGIDIDAFKFSIEARSRIRAKLGVDKEVILVGNIGRLASQKNPIFQLHVFKEFLKFVPSAKFCMVGRGELESDRDEYISNEKLTESVICIPETSEPASYYSAFDVLLFPPIFEGLTFVGIEAQCSGLPIVSSDVVPKELKMTELISFFSLRESPERWAEELWRVVQIHGSEDRSKYSALVAQAGYDIDGCFQKIAKAYRQ